MTTVGMAKRMKEFGVACSGPTISRWERWFETERVPPADYVAVLAQLAETTADYLMALTDRQDSVAEGGERLRLDFVRGAVDARRVGESVFRSPDGRVLLVELKPETAGDPDQVAVAVLQALRPLRSPSAIADAEGLVADERHLEQDDDQQTG